MAKNLEDAQVILDLVEAEEKRLAADQQKASRRLSLAASYANQNPPLDNNNNNGGNLAASNQFQPHRQPVQRSPSNSSVYRRNMWIKYALIENKLVSIVDYLGKNSAKYYESDALMSNYLCAQILSSLLVGLSALDFSRGKTNNYYQFDEPTAEELMKRHNLINPIACMCSHRGSEPQQHRPGRHQVLSRSATDGMPVTSRQQQAAPAAADGIDESSPPQPQPTTTSASARAKCCVSIGPSVGEQQQKLSSTFKRKPLALKTNFKCGTLITECHHYSCQEISERHPHNKGYSFLWCSSSSSSSNGHPSTSSSAAAAAAASCSSPLTGSQLMQQRSTDAGNKSYQQRASNDWPLWSPRMLHETLHQNSRSHLLYAKNNVLLETQPDQRVAGYLSLHQTPTDLILKWIPNQMINGGQPVGGGTCSPPNISTEQETDSSSGSSQEATESQPQSTATTLTATANKQRQALDCFYLDLVVNLSMSRVVLLQCQLLRNSVSQTNSLDCQRQQPTETSKNQQRLEWALPEESLVLIEADGVQRPPFKFPKGGLRSLISCLEQGLQPDRHLELAMRFDEHESPQSPGQLDLVGLDDSPAACSATQSEPKSPSRLDRLLRRLPSARRKQRPSWSRSESPSLGSEISTETPPPLGATRSESLDTRRAESTTARKHNELLYYIYRIAAAAAADKLPRQTPPLSATSANSLSSGSYNGGSNSRRNRTPPGDSQQFRWSLSRLARFSTIRNEESSNSESHNTDAMDTNTSIFGDNTGSLDRTIDELDDGRQPTRESTKGESLDDDVLVALRTQSVKTLCDSMRKQIVARAFHGWLAHCRRLRIIRTHLIKLLLDEGHEDHQEWDDNDNEDDGTSQSDSVLTRGETDRCKRCELTLPELEEGLTRSKWRQLMGDEQNHLSESDLSRLVNLLVYYGGIRDDNDEEAGDDDALRRQVWPYLLEHYQFKDTADQRRLKDLAAKEAYEACGRDWIRIERVVKQLDRAILEANMARASRDLARDATNRKNQVNQLSVTKAADDEDSLTSTQTGISIGAGGDSCAEELDEPDQTGTARSDIDEELQLEQPLSIVGPTSDAIINGNQDETDKIGDVKVGEPSTGAQRPTKQTSGPPARKSRRRQRARLESTGSVGSDASITDQFGNNIHRIDKDVQRCDRNFWYFKEATNLEKLRNIMCTYVWQHLDVGYVQGMCDLAAPFLVIFDDEVLAYSCFSQLMKRMVANFPHGSAMDQHFESLQHLMQVLDPKLFEIFQNNGDYTHFYFCYRWLLLDFKRGKLTAPFLSPPPPTHKHRRGLVVEGY